MSKKRRPQDLTLRNLRAQKSALARLTVKVAALTQDVRVLQRVRQAPR